jgi:hypothetical protein
MLRELKEQALSLRGSIVRAVLFALAWAFCPFWLFFLIALYLFFVPFSQSKSVIIPFLILLALTGLQSVGFYAAVIFGLIFWYILLIKEFYIVDRKSAYEILVLALTYLLFRIFYLKAGAGFGGGAVFLALIVAAVIGVFFSSFVKNFGGEGEGEKDAAPVPGASRRFLRQVTASTVFLVVFELLMTGLFLPLDFVYQSSIVFILTALFMELSSKHLFFGNLSRRRVLVVSSTAFVLLVLILGSARWGL